MKPANNNRSNSTFFNKDVTSLNGDFAGSLKSRLIFNMTMAAIVNKPANR
jgi:hypothetical protein